MRDYTYLYDLTHLYDITLRKTRRAVGEGLGPQRDHSRQTPTHFITD